MEFIQSISGIFLEHKLTFLLQCLKIQKNLEHKLKKALLLLNFKKTLKRQQPARRIAERITVSYTFFSRTPQLTTPQVIKQAFYLLHVLAAYLHCFSAVFATSLPFSS